MERTVHWIEKYIHRPGPMFWRGDAEFTTTISTVLCNHQHKIPQLKKKKPSKTPSPAREKCDMYVISPITSSSMEYLVILRLVDSVRSNVCIP